MYLLELVGEDDRFSIAEAAMACADVEGIAPGLATAATVDAPMARRLARTRTISEVVLQVEGDLEQLVDRLGDRVPDRTGSVAVRGRNVRGRTDRDMREVERRIGDMLTDHGLSVDLESPDHELRVLLTEDDDQRWSVGWTVVEPPRGYGDRRPSNRPFQQPGTMGPQLARTLVNLTGVSAGETMLDPMCGPGATLIEAALVDVHPIGLDVQRKMVEGSRRNLRAFSPATATSTLIRASATAIPLVHVDGAVFDAPYGRQSPIGHDSAPALVEATLVELSGLVDRCVAVFDRRIDGIARDTGWTVADSFPRRVHRSLTRHVTVLVRP